MMVSLLTEIKLKCERFQASATKQMRIVFFWVIRQLSNEYVSSNLKQAAGFPRKMVRASSLFSITSSKPVTSKI
jgi:hypothetical protein